MTIQRYALLAGAIGPTVSGGDLVMYSDYEALAQECERLRTANRDLHRRAQQVEAPRQQFKALLRQANDHWGDTWMHEFDRLLEAHKEIQAMFRELARVYEYPMNGDYMHSCMDSNVEFPREKHPGVWANCFLSKQGGMKSIRVLDEVRRAVDELVAARAKEST
ncbi:MAG TPA: hypothetical protein VF534_27240 [Paraburkholderia sp.]